MDTTTLLIIIVVLLLLGGGWYGRGRWYEFLRTAICQQSCLLPQRHDAPGPVA